MSTAVENLKNWFDKLVEGQQEEVINFLYEGKILLRKNNYLGPYPGFVTRGLHCGPAPLASSVGPSAGKICPACGRSL